MTEAFASISKSPSRGKAACSSRLRRQLVLRRSYDHEDLRLHQKTNALPIRHPKVIFENLGMLMICLGLGKMRPFPPQGDFPHSSHEGKRQAHASHVPPIQPRCICNSEERALTSTWGTPELNKAMEKGCRVSEITEVCRFTTKNSFFSK